MVTKLVPYTLDTENRMKKLFYLFGTIYQNSTKAFIEMQRHQWQVYMLNFYWPCFLKLDY